MSHYQSDNKKGSAIMLLVMLQHFKIPSCDFVHNVDTYETNILCAQSWISWLMDAYK